MKSTPLSFDLGLKKVTPVTFATPDPELLSSDHNQVREATSPRVLSSVVAYTRIHLPHAHTRTHTCCTHAPCHGTGTHPVCTRLLGGRENSDRNRDSPCQIHNVRFLMSDSPCHIRNVRVAMSESRCQIRESLHDPLSFPHSRLVSTNEIWLGSPWTPTNPSRKSMGLLHTVCVRCSAIKVGFSPHMRISLKKFRSKGPNTDPFLAIVSFLHPN